MGLEFQYQLCPTLLLADMEIENPALAFLYALSDEIRAQTSLFGIVPKIHFRIISLITTYVSPKIVQWAWRFLLCCKIILVLETIDRFGLEVW